MKKQDFLTRMNNPNVYLHITEDLNHNGEFKARIPEERLIRWNEDDTTPRVCVGENLDGCLTSTGIDKHTLVKVFFIDIEKLNLKDNLVTWEHLYQKNLVTDAVYTKEAWITKDFTVSEDDSVVIILENIDDTDCPYLVEYDIQKEADELNVDAVDLYEEKFGDVPNCICSISVGSEFSILDKELHSKIFEATQMIWEVEDCLEDEYEDDYLYEYEFNFLKKVKQKYEIAFMGEGCARKVFSLNNYVVKLPKSEDGELQSKIECEIYKEEQNSLTILNPSYNLIYKDLAFQPLLQKFNVEDLVKYHSIMAYLKDNDFDDEYIKQVEKEISILVNKYDLVYEDIIKMSSWGVKEDYDEKVYLLDYGTNEHIYNKYYA